LAIAPDGTLYVPTGRAILRVGPTGRAVPVPVNTDLTPLPGDGGSMGTFNPLAVAFAPNGDLLVVSGYYLLSLSPNGVLDPIEHVSTFGSLDGMTTTAGGSVFMVQSGGVFQHVTSGGIAKYRTVLPNDVLGFHTGLPKDAIGKWDIGGLTTSRDGTIYGVG